MQQLLKIHLSITQNLKNGFKSSQPGLIHFPSKPLTVSNPKSFSPKNLNHIPKNIFAYDKNLIDFSKDAPLNPAP